MDSLRHGMARWTQRRRRLFRTLGSTLSPRRLLDRKSSRRPLPESLESRYLLAAQAVITEFMAVNDSRLADQDGDYSDWLEVSNLGDEPLMLNGWHLTDDVATPTKWTFPDITLQPNEQVLVFASDKDRRDATDELHANFRLAGDGEYLALYQPDGVTVASEYAPEFPEQLSDVSYGVVSRNAQAGYFAFATPGAPNLLPPSVSPPSSLVINEIMYHPSSNDDADEYVELHNVGSQSIDLEGWRITGTIDFELPAFSIGPGEFLIVAADPVRFAETYGELPNVFGPWAGRLGNTTDTIRVRDVLDRVVDSVEYADEGEWAVRERGDDDLGTMGWKWSDGHDGGGRSLELINPLRPNQYGQNWSESANDGGSPGLTNSSLQTDSAPFLIDVIQQPVIPNASEAVVISAQVMDESYDNLNVRLFWRIDGAAQFTETPMNDRGEGGDLVARDGRFTVTLPAQTDRTVVEYYVHATDANASPRTWPAATRDAGQVTNALYQVIDEFDPVSVTVPGARPVYYQIMTAAEREEFTNINRSSDAEMNATFIRVDSNGVTQRHNAGIRIRGSGSRRDTPANNRVNIPSDVPLNGMTAFNFNTDTVRNQIVGSLLFRLAGFPTANATAARMFSNGQDLKPDYYALVEPLNGEFVDRHFPLDSRGNLYKGQRPSASPEGGRGAGLYYRDDPAAYVSYTKLTNESKADWSDVIHLTDVLNNTEDEVYLDEVAKVVDIDQWIRYFAFNALISNTEGGLVNGDRNGDDYAMYRGDEDSRFVMLPHDLDSILSLSTASINRTVNRASLVPALRRLLFHPELRSRFYQAFFDMMEEVFFSPDTEPMVRDALAGVVPENQINNIFTFFQQRAEFLRSFIPQGIDFTTADPIVDGRIVTSHRGMPLYGYADYRANSLVVNGQVVALDDTTNFFQTGSFLSNLISWGSEWSYLDDGSDQGTAWQDVDFEEDGAWKRGLAELGFGDGDEVTEIEYGGDLNDVHITTYFRHEFEVSDPSRWHSLQTALVRDDGIAIYLNGQEVLRNNLPNGELTSQTLALSHQEGGNERATRFFDLDASLLRPGKNVLAVEVHQAAASSPDLSFNLRLFGRFNQVNGGVPLQPGLNRYVLQAMSGADGTGEVIATETIDIWRTGEGRTVIDTDLPAGETRWTAEAGPYVVSGSVSVPADATLVIEPGTSIYFSRNGQTDGKLDVRGTLIARGTPTSRIRFTTDPSLPDEAQRAGLPDGPQRWDGIQFRDTMSTENVIAFADIEYAEDLNGSVGVIRSHVEVDNVTFAGAHARYVFGNDASMRLSNSFFPDMFPGDEDPIELGLDNVAEHVKIVGRTPDGGELIIQGNQFGTNKGHNDIIDADSNRVTNGPILQILDNVFAGAGDELLDLGGDVYVAGNHFRNVFKDDSTSDRGYANVISTGDAGADTTIVVARNYFYDVDHAINLKNSTATIFEYNTVVKIHPDFDDRFGNPNVGSAINLYVDEPGATTGKGAYVANNVFWDLPRVFGNADTPDDTVSVLQLENNLLSPAVAMTEVAQRGINTIDLGPGNVAADPRFADLENEDFSLRPGSLGRATGLPSIWGAEAEAALWVETPATPTFQTQAQVTVGGPGMFAYRYRLNGSDWSETFAIGDGFQVEGTTRTATFMLSGLTPGEQQLEVEGRDFAGNWQATPTRVSWTVDPTAGQIRLNEVQAATDPAPGTTAAVDLIELFNSGSEAINLKGFRISDRADQLDKHVFTNDLFVPSGGYVTLYAGGTEGGDLQLGFSLSRTGESVYLANADGELIDQVTFGQQLDGYSIGRAGPTEQWMLGQPSLGSANTVVNTGDVSEVRINEWLAESDTLADFIELYNRDTFPIDVGGLWLSDVGDATPDRYALPPLSFIGPREYLRVDEGELGFGLSNDGETLRLSYPSGAAIDSIVFGAQVRGYSQGRFPDGTSNFTYFANPSPGRVNGAGRLGDLNLDGLLNADDLDFFCENLRNVDREIDLDLNRDGAVDLDDHRYMVEVLFESTFGDANLDGVFDSRDLVAIFQTGQYEDGVPANSTWSTGDWNCDGDFSTTDLVLAFQSGRYSV